MREYRRAIYCTSKDFYFAERSLIMMNFSLITYHAVIHACITTKRSLYIIALSLRSTSCNCLSDAIEIIVSFVASRVDGRGTISSHTRRWCTGAKLAHVAVVRVNISWNKAHTGNKECIANETLYKIQVYFFQQQQQEQQQQRIDILQ